MQNKINLNGKEVLASHTDNESRSEESCAKSSTMPNCHTSSTRWPVGGLRPAAKRRPRTSSVARTGEREVVMNDALAPALTALGLGTSTLVGIHALESRREARMRSSRQRYKLTFPVGADPRDAVSALTALAGVSTANELVLEVRGMADGIEHFIHVPGEAAEAATHQLSAAIPGLRAEVAEDAKNPVSTLSVHVALPALSLLRTDDAASGCRGVLSHLAALDDDEDVRFYLALRPAETRVPTKDPVTATDRDRQRRLRQRAAGPTFAVNGLLVARAGSVTRARTLLDGIGLTLRSRVAEGAPARLTYDRSGRRLDSLPRTSRRHARITAAELVGLSAWPIGDAPIAGVTLGATRQMLVPRGLSREGVRLFVGRDVTGQRPVCLPPSAQRLHSFFAGPTGSGKSTLVNRLALDALAAKQAGMLVDGKDGSLGQSFLERVPDADRDRVIVVDPADATAPVGLDMFAVGDADTRAEQIVATLRAIFAPQGAWGVRSDFFLSLAIRSLVVVDRPSLLLVSRLLTDPALRRQVVGRLDDPVLQAAWAAFEALGPGAQRDQVAAPLNRLASLLQRPPVRAAIANPSPRLRLDEVWQKRCFVVVSLAPGVMGEGAARLMGAIYTFASWMTLEARSGQPESARVPTNLILDELQAIADVPVSIERLAERSRAFGGQLVLSAQNTSQLPTSLVDAICGNVATLVAFKPGAAEAQRLARELPGLEASDLMALGAYEVAARVATGTGAGTVTLTGRTEPLPRPTRNADYIRRRSAALYGTPKAELDEAVREQLGGDLTGADERPAPGRSRRVS